MLNGDLRRGGRPAIGAMGDAAVRNALRFQLGDLEPMDRDAYLSAF